MKSLVKICSSSGEDFENIQPYLYSFLILKRIWPFFWTNLKALPPRMLCAKFGFGCPVILEKKIKIWKVYDDNNRQICIRKAHKCLWLRWAKKRTFFLFILPKKKSHFMRMKNRFIPLCHNKLKVSTNHEDAHSPLTCSHLHTHTLHRSHLLKNLCKK